MRTHATILNKHSTVARPCWANDTPWFNLVGETVGSAVGSGVGSAVGAAVEGFVDGFQVGVGVVGAAVGPGVSNPALQLPEST